MARAAVITIIFAAALLAPTEARAMHIAEGILPAGWAALWWALVIPFIAFGLWRVGKLSKADLSYKPLIGLLAAVVFIISAMPVPVPVVGSVSHPTGIGVTAVLLGPAVSIVISAVALLLQALFLAHGGITTLGANVFTMGVMGSLAGFAVFKVLRIFGSGLFIACFFAGVAADWFTYMGTAGILTLGIMGQDPFMPLFLKVLVSFVPVQVPIGILEGFATAGVVTLLMKRRADILLKLKIIKKEEVPA